VKVAINQIHIKGRYRKDLGDLGPLVSSVRAVGLLQPVVVDSGNGLIAGQRRIEAAKLLGWTEIEAVVAGDLDDALRLLIAQRDENTCRKDFAPSEAVAVGVAFEVIESKAAKERQVAGGQSAGRGRKRIGSAKLAEAITGETREKVAGAVGMKRSTYEKAKAVVQAAKDDPERFGSVVADMDATGKVDRAYSKVRQAAKADKEKANAKKMKPGKAWVVTAAQDVVPCAALITDPPYGILDEPWEPKELESFTRGWCERWAKCRADTALIFWSQRYLWDGRVWFDEALAGYEFQQLLVWHYPNNKSPQSRKGFKQTWEPIFFYRLKGSPRQVQLLDEHWGDEFHDFDCHVAAVPQSNFNDADMKQHPAQKPVSVMRWLVNAVTRAGELVCDPFAGSGTTGIAALQLGGKFHGIENNRDYLAMAKGRIATYGQPLTVADEAFPKIA
jgi:ParB family chromosome partitioning protein